MNSWKLNAQVGHLTRKAICDELKLCTNSIYKAVKSIDNKGIIETFDGVKYKIKMVKIKEKI